MNNLISNRIFPSCSTNHNFKAKALPLIIGTCVSLFSSQSFSQQLEEIIVTSQKRSENLQDVPLSVSVLGGEALEQRTIRDLEDISMSTPGVYFNATTSFGGPSVSLRGITPGLNSATTNFYLDDMPLLQRADTRTALVVPHVFDLERVEILRGPQGTLYGAGAMGGAIRYITPEPSLTESSMRISSEYGFTSGGDDAYQVSLVGGTPLIDDVLGFRGGVFYRDEGGWIDRADRFTGEITERNINDTETYAIRGALLWEPNANFSLLPSFQYQSGKTGSRDMYWDLDPGFVTRDSFATPQDTDFLLANIKAEYEFSNFTAASITSYLDRESYLVNDWSETDADALGFDRFANQDFVGVMPWDVVSESITQEFRFSSIDNGQRLSWQAGLYYQDNEYIRERFEYQNVDKWVASILDLTVEEVIEGGWVETILGGPHITGPLSGTNPYGPESNEVTYYQYVVNTEKELAAYINLDYQVTDQFSIGLGFRASDTEFTNLEIQDGPWSGGRQMIDGLQEDTPNIGRFNATYNVTDDNMVYFTWSEGFRLGGSNQDFSSNPLCEPDLAAIGGQNPLHFTSDSLESYEIGTKNSIFDGRASISASLYRIDWSDIQRGVSMPSCLQGFSDNLGKAEVTGVDLEFEMQLTDSFRLSLAWGHNNGEFAGDTIKFGQTYALDGQEFEQPKVIGNASLYYNGIINNYDSYATFSVNYNGSYTRGVPEGVVGFAENELVISDAESVTVANFRAGINFDQFNLGIFVENVFDSDDAVGQQLTASGRTDITTRSLRPRVIGLLMDYNF